MSKEYIKKIVTQADLDSCHEMEDGMYYISMDGSVVTQNGKPFMTKMESWERLESIAYSSSQAIQEAFADGKNKEAKNFLNTFAVPFRIQ